MINQELFTNGQLDEEFDQWCIDRRIAVPPEYPFAEARYASIEEWEKDTGHNACDTWGPSVEKGERL